MAYKLLTVVSETKRRGETQNLTDRANHLNEGTWVTLPATGPINNYPN